MSRHKVEESRESRRLSRSSLPPEHSLIRWASKGCEVAPQAQDEKHASRSRFSPSSLQLQQLTSGGSSGPRPPNVREEPPCLEFEQEAVSSHDSQVDNHNGTRRSKQLSKRRRLETIVDEGPRPEVTTCGKRTNSPLKRPKQPSTQTTPEKKLKKVPPNAPKVIERKGKYTFRKGVRIRDYRIPVAKSAPAVPWSRQFQCRDSFDGHEIPASLPRAMKKMARETQLRDKEASSPTEELPPTPQSTIDQTTRPEGYCEDSGPKKERYDGSSEP